MTTYLSDEVGGVYVEGAGSVWATSAPSHFVCEPKTTLRT